jgi:drug/metabolite transporter (DMT)-like permease
MPLNLADAKSPLARLLLIAPFFLWGTAMVAMKGVIPQTTPLFMAGVRLLPAGILIVAIAFILGKPQPQGWTAWLWISLFALVDGVLFQGFLAEGLVRTGAGLGSVMIDSQPLAVALLALWLYGERIGFWGWLGLAMGVAGIGLIGLPDQWVLNFLQGNWLDRDFRLHLATGFDLFQQLLTHGEVWMLMAALAMAVGTVMIRQVSRYADPVSATGWHMIFAGLPLFLGSGIWESRQWEQLDLSAWLSLGYAAVFGSAIAYGLFFYYAAKGNLTSLSSLTFLTPVFALIFGNWLLAEVLSSVQLLGVCLTLVSIYLVNQRQQLANKFTLGRQSVAPISPPLVTSTTTNFLEQGCETLEIPVPVVESTAKSAMPSSSRQA